jgi:hypothetical protein
LVRCALKFPEPPPPPAAADAVVVVVLELLDELPPLLALPHAAIRQLPHKHRIATANRLDPMSIIFSFKVLVLS